MEISIARLYADGQARFAALFRSLDADQLQTSVPACPEWTVRDVLSHVAGVTDDVANGRIAGAGTDPWTASQVERNRELPVDELLARWDDQTGPVSELFEQFEQVRPVIDVETHRQDVRAALGLPAERDTPIVHLAATALVESLEHPVRVELGHDVLASPTAPDAGVEPIMLRGATAFDVMRSRLGRRSREQVLAYDWSADPKDIVDVWFSFGPATEDIAEP